MSYDAAIENENETQAQTFKFEKPLKRVLLVCSILLACELLWLFVITPCFPLADIDMQGLNGLSRSMILNKAGITSRSSFMSVNAKNIESALSTLPQIESVKVVTHFPDRIQIILKSRQAAAMSLTILDGKTIPLFFDRNGVIFKIGFDEKDSIYNTGNISDTVPILSGFVFENVTEGTRLPAFLLPLFDDLEVIRQKTPELLSVISEIHITKKPYDGFDLVLYPVYNDVKIKLGSEIKEETLRYMLLLLDVLNEKGLRTDEIDFRTGTAAYTIKT